MTQRFDGRQLTTIGGVIPLVEGLAYMNDVAGAFSVSRDGGLAYLSTSTPERKLKRVDRSGKPDPKVFTVRVGASPSNDQTLWARVPQTVPRDVWVLDIAGGGGSPITSGLKASAYPIWSPDDRYVVFSAESLATGFALFRKASNGSGNGRTSYQNAGQCAPTGLVARWKADRL